MIKLVSKMHGSLISLWSCCVMQNRKKKTNESYLVLYANREVFRNITVSILKNKYIKANDNGGKNAYRIQQDVGSFEVPVYDWALSTVQECEAFG